MDLTAGTILIFYLSSVMVIGQFSVDRTIVIDHLEYPENNTLCDWGTLRIKKYNRTTYTLNGYVTFLQRISDEHSANLQFYAYQGNEYRLLFEKNVPKLCTFLKNDELASKSLIRMSSWAPRIEECPLKDGDLHFYNAHFKNHQLPMVLAQLKKGKLSATYFFNDKVVLQFAVYVLIE